MSEIISIPILELMKKTEQWLLNQGYKKNTLGVYKATWNKFRAYSSSPFYDRETAEKFLLRYFGVDVNAIDQKLDIRMRHARRHMSALDEFLRTGEICRRKVRGITTIADDGFDLFFSRFLDFCREQNYSKSWLDNTISGLRIFLLATHVSHTKAMHLLRAGVNMIYIRDFLGHVDISTTEVYARIDAEMKRKVFEEKVPNFTPNTTMPWEEDKDLLQWLTQFGKKSF